MTVSLPLLRNADSNSIAGDCEWQSFSYALLFPAFRYPAGRLLVLLAQAVLKLQEKSLARVSCTADATVEASSQQSTRDKDDPMQALEEYVGVPRVSLDLGATVSWQGHGPGSEPHISRPEEGQKQLEIDKVAFRSPYC